MATKVKVTVKAKPKRRVHAFRESTYKFNIDIYNYTILVIASSDVRVSAERRGISVDGGWFAMHCGADHQPLSMMFFPYAAGAKSVAHEASHCTWHIMKTMGAEHEDEVMAYTTSHIVGEITRFLNRVRPKGQKIT